jgi:hypothetical protein
VSSLAGPSRLLVDNNDIYFTQYDSGEISKVTESTLGIEGLEKFETLIAPNPASDFIKIYGSTEFKTYAIHNVLGQTVKKSSKIKNNKIYLNELESGIYFIEIDKFKVFKLIKK